MIMTKKCTGRLVCRTRTLDHGPVYFYEVVAKSGCDMRLVGRDSQSIDGTKS